MAIEIWKRPSVQGFILASSKSVGNGLPYTKSARGPTHRNFFFNFANLKFIEFCFVFLNENEFFKRYAFDVPSNYSKLLLNFSSQCFSQSTFFT